MATHAGLRAAKKRRLQRAVSDVETKRLAQHQQQRGSWIHILLVCKAPLGVIVSHLSGGLAQGIRALDPGPNRIGLYGKIAAVLK